MTYHLGKAMLFMEVNVNLCPQNVYELIRKLPNIAKDGVRKVPFDKWNHFDYIFGVNAKEYVYDDVVDIIHTYERTPK